MTNHSHDIIDRLNAMRAQGKTMKCSNYFRNGAASGDVNESCRAAMAAWIVQVQRTLHLSPESVWSGMSCLDRYLGSGRGDSKEALKSRRRFQLAAITAFYTAVKFHEPVVVSLDMLTRICRGTYASSDFTAMEGDMLAALDWRVSCHTPMDFARHLVKLLPEELPPCVAGALLEDCQRNVDRAIFDIYFSTFAPSVLGTSCLTTSLSNSDVLSPSEKRACWSRLSELCGFDLPLTSTEVAASPPPHKQGLVRKLSQISQSNDTAPSSPVCITKAARLE